MSAPHPRVIADLSAHRLFAGPGDGTWIVGNVRLDRYVVLGAAAVEPVLFACSLLDGTRSEAAVAAQLREKRGQSLDVEELTGRLRSAGLIESADNVVERPYHHFDSMSLRLVVLPLERVGMWLLHRIRVVAALWFGGLSFAILASSAVLLTSPPAMVSGAPDAGWFVAALLACLLLHEVSHVIAAAALGLSPKSLTAALYLGYLPVLVLRIPGLFTLRPSERVAVWSAGCFANLAFALLGAAGAHLLDPHSGSASLSQAVGLANLVLACVNLFPFLPTDGYFIASTLLKQYNLRSHAWAMLLRRPVRKVHKDHLRSRRCLMIYAAGASVLIVYTMVRLGGALAGTFNSDGLTGNVLVRLVPVFLLVFTVCWTHWLHRHAVPRWEAARSGMLHQLRRLRHLHVSHR